MDRNRAGRWRHYLHDGLSEILGAPITQAGLEGGTDVVPVTTGLVAILARLDRDVKNEGFKLLNSTKSTKHVNSSKTPAVGGPSTCSGPLSNILRVRGNWWEWGACPPSVGV